MTFSQRSHVTDILAAHNASLRLATIDDAERIAEFAARVFYETFADGNTAEDMTMYLASSFGTERQRGEIADPNVTYLLMHVDNEDGASSIGAMALLRLGSTDPAVHGNAPIEIQRFYVDAAFRGRGVARTMMNACVAKAAALGGRTCWLGVWEKNPRAIRFYEKSGFTDVGEHTFYVGTDAQTDRIMMRSV